MTTASITVRTRMIVQDTGVPFAANFTLDGVSNVFDLPVESVSATATPPTVILNGVNISNQATPSYAFDYKHGVITFLVPPLPQGGTLGVSGISYDFFDDDEVAQVVQDAFNLHVNDQSPLPVINPVLGQPSISSTEEYCVAILAAIELLWFRTTDASQEIDIHTPEGVTIPRSERFRQLTQQIAALKAEYNQIAGALGVGLYRIQVLWQRRVSKTTNRLIPIFEEQEYNAPYTGFQPTAAAVGATVEIFGMYFTGTTDVKFGGVSVGGNFVVISDTQINAVVPAGAVTGQIQIVTPYGTVLSTAQFVVGQPAPYILYGPEQVTPPIPPGV